MAGKTVEMVEHPVSIVRLHLTVIWTKMFLSRPMAGHMLPNRLDRKSHKQDVGKRSPAHRAWVRGHACAACGCEIAIECAHVRLGTGGGMSMKPSDRWCISLCKGCH